MNRNCLVDFIVTLALSDAGIDSEHNAPTGDVQNAFRDPWSRFDSAVGARFPTPAESKLAHVLGPNLFKRAKRVSA